MIGRYYTKSQAQSKPSVIIAAMPTLPKMTFLALITVFVLGCGHPDSGTLVPGAGMGVPQISSGSSAVVTLTAVHDVWMPSPSTSWQWQLNGLPIDRTIQAEMYDIDLFDNDTATVSALHAEGRKVVCYVNAGGWEDWRPDAASFPDELIGENLDDWAGERWLDIRRIDLLAPIMEARIDSCQAKGFDGIELDNIDGFLNDTGFPLSYEDQLEYNIWLADAAHARGLSIGLKNDMEQIPDLLAHFDWALNEECFQYEECETLLPFIEVGKAVFNVEYLSLIHISEPTRPY